MSFLEQILANPGWLAVSVLTAWFMYEKILPSQLRKGEDIATMKNDIEHLKGSADRTESSIALILSKLIPEK